MKEARNNESAKALSPKWLNEKKRDVNKNEQANQEIK
jgi:hypothetical protein